MADELAKLANYYTILLGQPMGLDNNLISTYFFTQDSRYINRDQANALLEEQIDELAGKIHTINSNLGIGTDIISIGSHVNEKTHTATLWLNVDEEYLAALNDALKPLADQKSAELVGLFNKIAPAFKRLKGVQAHEVVMEYNGEAVAEPYLLVNLSGGNAMMNSDSAQGRVNFLKNTIRLDKWSLGNDPEVIEHDGVFYAMIPAVQLVQAVEALRVTANVISIFDFAKEQAKLKIMSRDVLSDIAENVSGERQTAMQVGYKMPQYTGAIDADLKVNQETNNMEFLANREWAAKMLMHVIVDELRLNYAHVVPGQIGNNLVHIETPEEVFAFAVWMGGDEQGAGAGKISDAARKIDEGAEITFPEQLMLEVAKAIGAEMNLPRYRE